MWYTILDQQIELHIFVKPHAKKTSLIACNELALHIALHAKPLKGAANKELIAYLAKILQIPKTQIILKKGEKSRHKQVVVPLTHTLKRLLADADTFIATL